MKNITAKIPSFQYYNLSQSVIFRYFSVLILAGEISKHTCTLRETWSICQDTVIMGWCGGAYSLYSQTICKALCEAGPQTPEQLGVLGDRYT